MTNAREARAILKAELNRRGITPTKITARTWNFEGFGYGKRVDIEIAGITPTIFAELKEFSKNNGFGLSISNN
jgi:hypothetical protein